MLPAFEWLTTFQFLFTFFICCNNALCPVISPLLFLIFINDIDVDLHPDTIASLFADDTATWMVDGKIKGSNRTLMQEEIDKILAWASKWKMSVNKGKTKSMIISSSNKDTKWDPQFQAGHQNQISQRISFP